MGFVQADPIRSPARAQDLILRHRVDNYVAGDLERLYPKLDIEEDFLYAYGFLPRTTWRLLHPRTHAGLSALETEVLRVVKRFGQMHPRELEAHLGRERTVNAWGGYSKATTHALQKLHHCGLLRVARRESGIRIYETTEAIDEHSSFLQRSKAVVLLLVRIFAPVSRRSLGEIFRLLSHGTPALKPLSKTMEGLVESGELASAEVDGFTYLWPGATRKPQLNKPDVLRLLTPFDPLVWDRRRFEHLWGWRYRFEAYTPPAKRQLGYYAMPMLWRNAIPGWANVSVNAGQMRINLGFVEKRPSDPLFEQALEEEVERLRIFLQSDVAELAR